MLYCRKHRVYNSYMVWLSCIGVWIIYYDTNHGASHYHYNNHSAWRSMCDVQTKYSSYIQLPHVQ